MRFWSGDAIWPRSRRETSNWLLRHLRRISKFGGSSGGSSRSPTSFSKSWMQGTHTFSTQKTLNSIYQSKTLLHNNLMTRTKMMMMIAMKKMEKKNQQSPRRPTKKNQRNRRKGARSSSSSVSTRLTTSQRSSSSIGASISKRRVCSTYSSLPRRSRRSLIRKRRSPMKTPRALTWPQAKTMKKRSLSPSSET